MNRANRFVAYILWPPCFGNAPTSQILFSCGWERHVTARQMSSTRFPSAWHGLLRTRATVGISPASIEHRATRNLHGTEVRSRKVWPKQGFFFLPMQVVFLKCDRAVFNRCVIDVLPSKRCPDAAGHAACKVGGIFDAEKLASVSCATTANPPQSPFQKGEAKQVRISSSV